MANFENRTLFHGDNLPFLRAMNTGSVDLIATDPPFNKGRDFHATPDSLAAGAKFQDRWSWEDDVEGEWVDQITDDWPNVWNVIQGARESFGDDMGAFLCFMGVRLIAMRRVLRDDGSLYLHCDPTASHYLKQLLDAIFGRKQFRNEIVWQRAGVKGDARRKLGANHDLILVYGKSPSTHFEVPRLAPDSEYLTRFNLDDNDGRGTYHSAPLDSPSERPNLTYEYKGYPPPVKGWRVDRAEMQRLDDDGRLIFPRKSNGRIRRKLYLSEAPGPPAGDVWTDIPAVGSSNERMGYPTQKPLALYERIIEASSRGDWVLDPFAGCATTCVAVERMGRKWVGIDLWDGTHRIILDRLQDEGLAGPGGDTDRLFTFGDLTYTDQRPERTDDGEAAAPFLQVTERYAEPAGPRMSRAQMLDHLVAQHGCRCQGCDRTFDDPRYLQLDHNTPRADGGINHIINRVLLCGPCNQLKAHIYTLSGLRRENEKRGYMARDQNKLYGL